jgi:hypothetical protein
MALDVVQNYKKEVQKNKSLFNEIQDLKGNMRVYCRVRPLTSDESTSGEIYSTAFPEEDAVSVLNNGVKKLFEFEKVFTPESTQGSFFNIFYFITYFIL